MQTLPRLIILCTVLNGVLLSLAPSARCADLSASEIAAQDALVTSLQPKIKSDDLRMREEAFDELTAKLRKNNGFGRIDADRAAPSTKHAVTELLSYEFWAGPSPTSIAPPVNEASAIENGEALSSYVPALLQAVMELHDPDSIPLLYKPEVLTSGAMATDALAYFGKTEARHVMRLFASTRWGDYNSSLEMVLFAMLGRHMIDDPELRAHLRNTFLNQTFSTSAAVRMFGIQGLSHFADSVAKDRLAYLAAHDPSVNRNALDHKPIYPVRDEAALALRRPLD